MSRSFLTVRRGMTLIEVMFAIVILSGVMLALSRFGTAFSQATSNAAVLAIASDLATNRIELIRAHPVYETLVSTYSGATETSSSTDAAPSMTGYEGFERTTTATRTQSDTTDFVTVTVTVTGSTLTNAVSKTVVISAF